MDHVTKRITITKRALVARIRRRLDESKVEGVKVKLFKHKAGDFETKYTPGSFYYTVNMLTGSVLDDHVRLEAYALELGVMSSYEELA